MFALCWKLTSTIELNLEHTKQKLRLNVEGHGLPEMERFLEMISSSPSILFEETKAQNWWNRLPTDTWPFSEKAGDRTQRWPLFFSPHHTEEHCHLTASTCLVPRHLDQMTVTYITARFWESHIDHCVSFVMFLSSGLESSDACRIT